jgi:hypothetical protein
MPDNSEQASTSLTAVDDVTAKIGRLSVNEPDESAKQHRERDPSRLSTSRLVPAPSRPRRNFSGRGRDRMRKNGRKDGSASRALTYKTEICRSHHDLGYCEYEDKCQFAHGVEQLRPRKFSPKYKTQLCKNYHKFGNCRFGSRCQFIHDEQRIQVAENEFWLISQSEHLMRIEVVGGASQVTTSVDGMPPLPVPLPLPPPPVPPSSTSPETPVSARRAGVGGGSEVMTLPMHESMPLQMGLPQGTAPGAKLSPTSKPVTPESPPETQTTVETGEQEQEQEQEQDEGDEGENEGEDEGEEYTQQNVYYTDMYGQEGQYMMYPDQFQYHPDLYFGPVGRTRVWEPCASFPFFSEGNDDKPG